MAAAGTAEAAEGTTIMVEDLGIGSIAPSTPCCRISPRHLTVYSNLIFKALKNDADDEDYAGVGDERGWMRTSGAGGGRRAITITKRLLHTAQHAGSVPGLAAAVLLVSEASSYRPAICRAFNRGKGEGENDDGGKGMGPLADLR